MPNQDDPVKPIRRRRARKPKPVLADSIDDGASVDQEAALFLMNSPLYDDRRIHFGQDELIALISESLLRHGMDPEAVGRSKWLWQSTPAGAPMLYILAPGIEA